MASDFEYTGIENHQCGFKDRSSGTTHWLQGPSPADGRVELLDGDEVIIQSGNSMQVHSIRERRVVRNSP